MVLILTSGLTVWMFVPSLSSSLQTGLGNYGNQVSTFIVIQNNAGPHPSGSKELQTLVPQIESITGVQAVYPVDYNYTYELTSSNLCLSGRECTNATLLMGLTSAAIGGKNGYPPTLVSLVKGHMPQGNESAFIENNSELGIFHNGTYRFMIGGTSWNSTRGVKFNATIGGVSALNPLTGEIQILWNSTFLQHELGSRLYNSTFSGPPNFVIIKVGNIGEVENVAASVSELLKSDPSFFVTYDQATLLALQSLESQSVPLYWLLTGISLGASAAIIFLISYLGAARRKWEPGLFMTQGWTWAKYAMFILTYFLVIAVISFVVSALVALSIDHFVLYQFQVAGNILTVKTAIDPFYVISAVPLSLFVSSIASLASISRLKRMGLDNILRDY